MWDYDSDDYIYQNASPWGGLPASLRDGHPDDVWDAVAGHSRRNGGYCPATAVAAWEAWARGTPGYSRDVTTHADGRITVRVTTWPLTYERYRVGPLVRVRLVEVDGLEEP